MWKLEKHRNHCLLLGEVNPDTGLQVELKVPNYGNCNDSYLGMELLSILNNGNVTSYVVKNVGKHATKT